MDSFLRDLMAHAEWANAIFFHSLGKISQSRSGGDAHSRWTLRGR